MDEYVMAKLWASFQFDLSENTTESFFLFKKETDIFFGQTDLAYILLSALILWWEFVVFQCREQIQQGLDYLAVQNRDICVVYANIILDSSQSYVWNLVPETPGPANFD